VSASVTSSNIDSRGGGGQRSGLPLVVPDAAPARVGDEARERVELLPALELLLRAVGRGVVRGRVGPDPVGERLDQRGPPAGARALHGLAHRPDHRQEVVAVDLDARHAVAVAARGQVGCGRLDGLGRRDRIAVVADHVDRGHAEHAAEVDGGVEVALRRGSLAQEGQGDLTRAAQLGRVGEPAGVGELRADGAADRGNVPLAVAVVDRHLAAQVRVAAVADELVENHVERHAAPQDRAELAVAQEDRIGVAQAAGGADGRRLLARARHVEAETALALQREEAAVDVHGAHLPLRCRSARHRVRDSGASTRLCAGRTEQLAGMSQSVGAR
jgi:hypothetical protein